MPEIVVKLQNPEELSRDDILECQNLAYDAYRGTLRHPNRNPLSHDELKFMTWMDAPERYYDAFRDLNTEVGKSLGDDQDFKNMHVARAYVDGVIGGYGYSADNVSGGSEFARNLKRRLPMKNYFYVREILTLPEFKAEGVATENAKALLEAATSPQQTLTHYDWPELQPNFVNRKLETLFTVITHEKPVKLFGPGTKEVTRVRRAGITVEKMLAKLATKS
jgi:hypothetical protein